MRTSDVYGTSGNGVKMSRTNAAAERVAPEVQAARALFSPDNQKQIERLADDLELILGGDAPGHSSPGGATMQSNTRHK